MIERDGTTKESAFMTTEEYLFLTLEQIERELREMVRDEAAVQNGEKMVARFGPSHKERALNLLEDLDFSIRAYPNMFPDSDLPSPVEPEKIGAGRGIGAGIRLLALRVFGRSTS